MINILFCDRSILFIEIADFISLFQCLPFFVVVVQEPHPTLNPYPALIWSLLNLKHLVNHLRCILVSNNRLFGLMANPYWACFTISDFI